MARVEDVTDVEEDDTLFHVKTSQANRAGQAGQGVGAREIAAMRDAGEDDHETDDRDA